MSHMNANTIPRISAYIDRVQRVTDAGGTVTKAYDDAVTRWHDWAELRESSPMQALTDAYEAGATVKQLATLRAAALADQATNAMMEAGVHAAVAPAALSQIMAAYHPTRDDNYRVARDAYNALARQFTTLAETVDVEADARTMVAADETTRSGWLKAEVLAHQLTQAAAVVEDAATLAAHPIADNGARIGLLVNTNSAHRRKVWAAYENTDNRCGKWSALVALGCTLEAPALDDATAYREPRPIEKRQVHNGIGVRMVDVDPEDADYTPAKRDPRDVLAV